MKNMLWVGLGGFLGANARFWVGGWAAARMGATFPYGTLLINVSGSLILGFTMGLLEVRTLSPVIRLGLAIGFVGAYTTFSTFTYETIRLLEDGSDLRALLYVFGSVMAGLAAALLGLAAGRAL
jgi:CrcB protein